MKILLCMSIFFILTNYFSRQDNNINKFSIKPCVNKRNNCIKTNRKDIVSEMYTNLDEFVDGFNKNSNVDKLNAAKTLRHRKLRYPHNSYYFDFDSGYAIITENYEVIKLENYNPSFEEDIFVSDEIEFRGNTFYSIVDDVEKELIDSKYDIKLTTNSDSKLSIPRTLYPGQYSEGDGKIYDIALYTAARYPGYELYKSYNIPDYRYTYQFDTSFYLKDTNASEGNCVINSTYSMLVNMARKLWNKKYFSYEYYVDYESFPLITNDPQYFLTNLESHPFHVNDRNRIGIDYFGYTAINNMPHLYCQLREYAIDYGYDPRNGLSLSFIPNMINDINTWYVYDSTFYETGNMDSVINLIDSSIPCVVESVHSETYGNHAMAAKGYYVIKKEITWGLYFTHVDYKYFIAVDDGRSRKQPYEYSETYYDGNVVGGYNFICANKNSLILSLC